MVHGFLHICTINNWEKVVDDQLRIIIDSGLYARLSSLYCGIVGEQNTDALLVDLPKVKILYRNPDITHFEFLTLECLQEFCKSQAVSGDKLFYVHTKGISKKGKPDPISEEMNGYLSDWRNYLNHYILEQHEDCIKQLDHADVVGVNWRGVGTGCPIAESTASHFSGNFWWAQTDYINQLGVINEGSHGRCEAELWLGKGEGTAISLFQTDINHYKQRYDKCEYENKMELHKWRFQNQISQRIIL